MQVNARSGPSDWMVGIFRGGNARVKNAKQHRILNEHPGKEKNQRCLLKTGNSSHAEIHPLFRHCAEVATALQVRRDNFPTAAKRWEYNKPKNATQEMYACFREKARQDCIGLSVFLNQSLSAFKKVLSTSTDSFDILCLPESLPEDVYTIEYLRNKK
jgi:hypothetical protein